MRFTVGLRPRDRKILQFFIPSLPARIEAVMRHFPHEMAKLYLEDLKTTAPGDIPGYPKMLKVRELKLPGIKSTFGVVAPGYAHSARLRGSDAKVTAIWVRPKTYQGEVDPGVVVLARHNPWTMDTLPYEPERRHASLVSRRVTEREVQAIMAKKKLGQETVKRDLAAVGIRKTARTHAVLLTRRVSRDIAFEVLRREFGLTQPHVAHWRPALKRARSLHVTQVLKKMQRWLTVPGEQRWQRDVEAKPERAATAKRVKEFQDRIAKGGR